MIDVVGVGAEGFAELPASLQERVLDADVVLGGARHLAMLPFEEGQVREPWPSPLRTALPALLERFDDLDVVALASGDPLVSGIGTTLVALLGADAVRIAPAVSSVALARAAMGWSAESCAVVSVVGRPVELVARELAPGRRIIVLSSDGGTPVELAEMLVRLGFGASELHVLGNLGGADETHQTMTAYRVAGADPSPAERTTTTAKRTTTTAEKLVAAYFSSVGIFTARNRLVRFIVANRPSVAPPKMVQSAMCGVPYFGWSFVSGAGSIPARAMANRLREKPR